MVGEDHAVNDGMVYANKNKNPKYLFEKDNIARRGLWQLGSLCKKQVATKTIRPLWYLALNAY